MRARTLLALCLCASCGCDGSIQSRPGGGPGTPDASTSGEGGAGGPDAGGLDTGEPDAGGEPRLDAGREPPDQVDAAPPERFVLDDSLRGETRGNLVGGELRPEGWTVTARTDRLWYALPRLVEGAIEFTISNVSRDNLLAADNEMFAMYEAGHGIEEPIRYSPEFRNNHYKCMLRVYGQAEGDRIGAQKLMWGMCPSGAPGYDACGCASFFAEPFAESGDWTGAPTRFRVEWGNGLTRLLRDGSEVVSIDWSDSGLTFGPEDLHFSLGTSRPAAWDDAALPIGAVFSDLHVEGRIGEPATCP